MLTSSRLPSPLRVLAVLCVFVITAGCVDHSKDVARYRNLISPPATAPAFDPEEPLPLARALRVANEDNEAIASSGEDYIQALAEKMRAAGTFLPTLSLAPSYNLTKSRGSSGFVLGGTGTDTGAGTGTGSTPVVISGSGGGVTHQTSVPIGANFQTSLTNVSDYQAAGRTVEQRKQLLFDQRETVLLSVVQSYYDVLRYERQLAVYESSVGFRAEQVRDQEARLKLGGSRPLDLAQSQSDLASTRVSLTQARTDAVNARSALARLMGVSAVAGPLTDAFEPPTDLEGIDVWQRLAAIRRQDLLATLDAREAARIGIDAAIREYFPSVSINFDYFLYNDPKTSQTWSSGISANIPLFSGLAIESDIRAAWSRYRQSELTVSQTRRTVRDDITQNYNALYGSRAKVQLLRVQVEAAEKAAGLAESAYKLGSGTNLDRLTQQDELLTARLNLADEEFQSKRFYLALLRSSGALNTMVE